MRRIVGTALLAAAVACLGGRPAAAETKAEVGKAAPDFTLTDCCGKEFSLAKFKEENAKKPEGERAKAVVLIFWSYNCGVGKAYDKRVKLFTDEFKDKPVAVFAVNSNFNETVEDSKAYLKKQETSVKLLMDPKGEVADLFNAKSVTTSAVLDAGGVVRYWGSIDNKKDVGQEGRKAYLESAVKCLLEGKEIVDAKTDPFG